MNNEEKIEDKRLKILKNEEIKLLYERPDFSQEERAIYFNLAGVEQEVLSKFRSNHTKINFILQLGYFKYKNRFFSFEINHVQDDINFIFEKYFKNKNIKNIVEIDKKTRLLNQRFILKLNKYKYFDSAAKEKIEEKCTHSVKIFAKPIYIFRDACRFLDECRTIIPSYSYMQDLVTKTIKTEQERLIQLTEQLLTKEVLAEIDDLVTFKNEIYELTSLKKSPKDFKYHEIKKEIKRGSKTKNIYVKVKHIIPQLSISNESIKYYASLVDFYSVYRLSRLDLRLIRVYIVCFLYHRYHKFNDNLINSMIYHIRTYDEASKIFANEKILEYRMEGNNNVSKAGKILKIFVDKSIPDSEEFLNIKNRAFKLLDEKKLAFIADYIENRAKFDDIEFRWQYIDKINKKFKLNLRPVILNIDFGSSEKRSLLLNAINALKESLIKGKGSKSEIYDFKENFIPKKILKYIYLENKIISDRYEFLIYKLLRNNLESGDIYCSESIRFKSFESELIGDKEWENRHKIIEELGLDVLKKPIHEHLYDLETLLETKIESINKKIDNGENEYFLVKNIGKSTKWSLSTPSATDTVNHPIFETLKQIDISDVLYFCETHVNFIESFDHILGRYVKNEVDSRVIIACLIAWATNMGLTKMGEISDVNYNKLASASDNYFRLETLQDANDKVTDALYKIPIFSQYHINDVIHSSSDGQKYETKISTINARNSPKYFGLKKGVVSYTLVANHIPINAKIIGANEHESHYVFDVLFNNTSDIKPEIHSTDTHGANEVNFAILYIFGYQFAPRYKDFHSTFTKSLYGFKALSEYKEFTLKPIRKIKTKLIVEEWDTIQRIMLSLGVKSTTQSIIVGKLSSYARKNKTRRALWEYNNIIKSIYLLDYVDSPNLRQNVQRALNRGESYHQLRRAVSYANFGKLKFKTEDEQQIWNECARLVTNTIIFYNESIFVNLIDSSRITEDLIKSISPIAWQHINFFGRYEFNKKLNPLDLSIITQPITK